MKKLSVILLTLTAACTALAEPVDSNVIHDYNYVGVGYGFLNDVVGNEDAHGITADLSLERRNFVFGAFGGYFTTVDGSPDVDVWNIGGSVGYVLRLMNNHFNAIPRFGIAYNKAEVGSASADTTTYAPGFLLSYAFQRFSVNAGYSYVFDEDDNNVSLFSVGTEIAIGKKFGVVMDVTFDDEDGFNGGVIGGRFHF